MIYLQFARFLLPLLLTMVAVEFGEQVLNGGMARVPQATDTLASYGLAWGLVTFLSSPLLQSRQLGLVLVDSRLQPLVFADSVLCVAAEALKRVTHVVDVLRTGVGIVHPEIKLVHRMSGVNDGQSRSTHNASQRNAKFCSY